MFLRGGILSGFSLSFSFNRCFLKCQQLTPIILVTRVKPKVILPKEIVFDSMKLMDVVTELTEVRDNENKTLHHGGRNRGEGLDLGILEMESRGECPMGSRIHRLWGTNT